jgi:hypothetical protein
MECNASEFRSSRARNHLIRKKIFRMNRWGVPIEQLHAGIWKIRRPVPRPLNPRRSRDTLVDQNACIQNLHSPVSLKTCLNL